MDGLTPARQTFFKAANKDSSKQKLEQLYTLIGEQAIANNQNFRDMQGASEKMSTDSWSHDLHFLHNEKARLI
ncbi:hypothetical protein [Paraglaciecola sp. 20A4]|uniref:hypothetical protein n=1 Tax=Paraglaciecola sp. 20A4 TaxID=2687288 RepID=UPI00197CDA0E|nr:hypothetical protein [Paraglaciecola sp. 20A4]